MARMRGMVGIKGRWAGTKRQKSSVAAAYKTKSPETNLEALKMAATYSPTMQRSTIGDAVCGRLSRLSPAPCPLSRLSPAPLCARLRLYPAPLMHREDNGAAHSWDITRKVSLKKKIGLSLFSSDSER